MSNNVSVIKDSNSDYHSKFQYISSSQVKTICKKSIRHYLDEEMVFGPALTIGSAFHAMVLEPEIFDSEFLVINEDINRRTKVGKQRFAILEKQAMLENKEILLQKDYEMIQSMTNSVNKKQGYANILESCQKEISIYIENFRIPDLDHDFRVRVRPDAYCRSPIYFSYKTIPNVVIDLKSCQDASPRAFKSSVYMYGWHIQAAYYLDLLSHASKELIGEDFVPFDTFYFLAVEKKIPYEAQMYELSPQMIEDGRKQYRKALKMWYEYQKNGKISGYHYGDQEPSDLIVL